MRTVTIEIKNSYAYKLLQDLEKINIIRLLSPKTVKNIAEQYAGILSKKTGKKLHEQLKQIREEWDRSI